MRLRRILTILVKDLKDAIRDARVLFALLLPLVIGVFYNVSFTDESLSLITANVAYSGVGDEQTRLPELLAASLSGVAEIEVNRFATAAEVEQSVRDDDADLGFSLPAGFDAAVAAGGSPPIQLFTPGDTTLGGDYVLAAFPGVLAQLANAPPPASVTVTSTAEADAEASVFDRLSPQEWAVISSLVTMIAMVSLLAVPIVLAEEAEKKTLDALTMVSSYAEVIAGKALLGVVYVLITVPMLLLITGQRMADWPMFVLATSLVTAALLGFGLLLAGLFKSANQLNTWGGLFLGPAIGPAFAVALPLPDLVMTIVEWTPTGAASMLLLNASTGERLFDGELRSVIVIALWAALAFGLLLWRLSRREG